MSKRLQGEFETPGDKSISHRIALMSLLAYGRCAVSNYSTAQDCITTLQAVRSLGGSAAVEDGVVAFEGLGGKLRDSVEVECGNSGTTMRLLMGILAGVQGRFSLVGDESLMKRPMERVAKPLRQMGGVLDCGKDGTPPVRIVGARLAGVRYMLPVPSAQLKSAVLLAATRADGATRLFEPVKSRDHTERLLVMCGARIHEDAGSWIVKKSDLHLPAALRIPGDPSSAAFLLGCAALTPGSEVTAKAILLNTTRIRYLDKFEQMGIDVQKKQRGELPEPWGDVTVTYSDRLRPVTITANEMPLIIDEIPILVLLATQAHGVSVFQDIRELRIKESDRVSALASELGKLGAHVEILGNDMIVRGPRVFQFPDEMHSFGDHRIAMTLAVACFAAGMPMNIDNLSCFAVSYPNFLATMMRLTE